MLLFIGLMQEVQDFTCMLFSISGVGAAGTDGRLHGRQRLVCVS